MHPLLESLAPWIWEEEAINSDPQAALTRDSDRVKAIARGEAGATARLWENPQCLVVTRRETRLPLFTQACETLAQEGWPVLVRDSGGTAVPHGPGILHFSLAFAQPATSQYDLDQVYQALCEPLRQALTELGLDAQYGSVEGAYCDGRYNLVIDGLKVTGTAQRVIAATGDGIKNGVLAQAMLMVDSDAGAGTHIVNRFYALAGDTRQYDPTVSTCVRERLGTYAPDQDLTQEFRSRLRRCFSGLTGAHTGNPIG